MASTAQFQVKPDFYTSKEECDKNSRERINTNPRYKYFNQIHFTAGDEEQFYQYKDSTTGQLCITEPSFDSNRFFSDQDKIIPFVEWEKYKDINAIDIDNTFTYIFNKFKKGIFIKIKDNKLAVFLPFSKKNFTNEWSEHIRIDPKYKNMEGFVRYISKMENRKFSSEYINKFMNGWYGNNCLIRYEFPLHEGDTNHSNMSDLLKVLCEQRKLPDCEFFLNRRDFPILKKDGTEAYEDLFESDKHPLVSHDFSKYAPILSMVTRKNYADIPIPTGEDWTRISSKEKKFFIKNRIYNDDFKTSWNDKKPTAVFRGSSTGCGTTIDTNPRLKLAYMSKITPYDTDNLPLLDAGITSWNIRPRKLRNEKYLQTIEFNKLPFTLSSFMNAEEQSQHKYIIHVDGHVSAFRLSLELSMGSCILLQDSKYIMWFRTLLIPYTHYVPINHDLSDLIEKIKWCKQHDAECEKIANNAKKFYNKYLTKDGILDYMQILLYKMKKVNGIYMYNIITPPTIQFQREKNIQTEIPKNKNVLSVFPPNNRSYGLLKGIEWVISDLLYKKLFFNNVRKQSTHKTTKSTNTEICSVSNMIFLTKTIKIKDSESKYQDGIHEIFIAKYCINELVKYVPNFAYIFDSHEDSDNLYTYMEYIEGETLDEYLEGKNFNMEEYIHILYQLGLALKVAQNRIGFVHNDLAPWNIILQRIPFDMTFDYLIDCYNIYRVTTRVIPVIIDYGKSHVVYNNKHYGRVNMFKMNSIQDTIHVLYVSLFTVLQRFDFKKYEQKIISLINFISGTKYREKPFTSLGEIKHFLFSNKKYSNLIKDDKNDLKNNTPIDFVKYLYRNNLIKVFKTEKVEYTLNTSNPLQIYNFTFATTDEERIKSFTDIFHKIIDCKLPKIENKLLAYYTVYSIKNNLLMVYKSLVKFINSIPNVDTNVDKYTALYQKTIDYIVRKYRKVLSLENQPFIYSLPEKYNPSYNESIFLVPTKVYNLLKSGEKSQDVTVYKEIIENILCDNIYQIPDDMKKFYLQSLSKLLEIDSFKVKKSCANYHTLKFYAKKIYSADNEYIMSRIEKGEECNEINKLIRIYKKIVNCDP